MDLAFLYVCLLRMVATPEPRPAGPSTDAKLRGRHPGAYRAPGARYFRSGIRVKLEHVNSSRIVEIFPPHCAVRAELTPAVLQEPA